MKVLFSNPVWWTGRQGSLHQAGVRAGSRWPFTQVVRSWPDHPVVGDYLPAPKFLEFAAAYCARATGASVTLRDSIARRESYESYYKHLAYEKYDFIVIETSTPSWDHDAQVISAISQLCPDSKVVACGPITATRAEEILEKHPVHACCKGEFEKGVVRVVGGEHGVIDFDLLSAEEMNAAPFPLVDEECVYRYWDANPQGQLHPHLQCWTTRGCQFRCAFCSFPAAMTNNDVKGDGKRTVRYYTEDYLTAYFTETLAKYQFRSIYLDSDTENMGTKHTTMLCRVLKKTGLPWFAMCRADTIKMETWDLMAESGCKGVKLGFETGNQYVNDNIINKHLDLDYAAKVAKHVMSIGMSVHGTFSIGHPGETKGQMLETQRYIEKLGLTSYQLSGVAELEGTPLHKLTLRGHLDKYPGAKIDAGYRRETDGNVKMQKLVRELQES